MWMTPFKRMLNKKVLLRERKRHTARRVVSTPSVVLTGYPPRPDLAGGGYLTWVPPPVLTWGGTWPGYPPSRVPPISWPGKGGYLTWVPPSRLDLAGYPPSVSAPWHSGKCCKALFDMGTPPPRCGQTNKVKLLPSCRTTYVGGNKGTFHLHFPEEDPEMG